MWTLLIPPSMPPSHQETPLLPSQAQSAMCHLLQVSVYVFVCVCVCCLYVSVRMHTLVREVQLLWGLVCKFFKGCLLCLTVLVDWLKALCVWDSSSPPAAYLTAQPCILDDSHRVGWSCQWLYPDWRWIYERSTGRICHRWAIQSYTYSSSYYAEAPHQDCHK